MRFWMYIFFVGLMQVTMAQNSNGVDGDSAFAKANSSYTAENYQEAIDAYESILQSGQHSAEVYFNLGNSYYKLNQVGPAIYNYEKALQMEPSNKDFKNNLKFAEQLRVDAVEDAAKNPVQEFLNNLAGSLSVDNWAYVSIMLALVTILMFLLYHYAMTTGKKRLFFTLALIGLILMTLSIVAANYSQNLMEDNEQAIIYSQETITRTEPKDSATASFTIHEGTKVTVLEEYEGWTHIEVANGSRAWLPSTDLKKL
ncbi:BatE, tetratricopeptide repeat family protein [Nonlabens sp. YIK11]|uniref:tetratricopeptide repeat protein n=1 Tax=Nonlabens sp. YIK11 TaxID=1453349 RepID=UPI0006DCDBD4|nr:tetratricopeptide repeat protein [Nonlabens sp. YIK11]KQC32433.1 BatE, tetratricopeptide repeat family protein [Nonlabens sp. YIK11]